MLNIILSLINPIENFFGNPVILTTTSIISILVKLFLVINISRRATTPKIRYAHFLLAVVLLCAIIDDISWIVAVITYYGDAHYQAPLIVPIFLRASWIGFVIFYQALALFIQNLIDPHSLLRWRQNIFFLAISFLFIVGLSYVTINTWWNPEVSSFQLWLQGIFPAYAIFFLIPHSLWYVSRQLKQKNKPHLLHKQYKIIAGILIIPRLVEDFIQFYPFKMLAYHDANSFAIIGCASLSLTGALFYCSRRIIGLRFLNFNSHVQPLSMQYSFNFINDFKEVLEQLSRVFTLKELGPIAQTFFKEAFSIPLLKTNLFIRHTQSSLSIADIIGEFSQQEVMVEHFLASAPDELLAAIHKQKILIYDEIDFTYFYEEDTHTGSMVHFLNSINADIWLPIYKNHTIIAYLAIERGARPDEFYSDIERDEMIVFARYLGNIINLLQTRTLEPLLQKEKELQEELYQKHQEIHNYKESMRSFLKQPNHEVGIIFYKNRRFSYANHAAQEIVPINLNTYEGHSLTKTFKKIAHLVDEYKTPQKILTTDEKGNKLAIDAIPALDKTSVIITVSHPDSTDIINNQLGHLKDPTKWDYLLYLETTSPGKLINQMLPGGGETILNFKIQLLEMALSRKALLLEVIPDDLMAVVELFHHISMRDTLHVLRIDYPNLSSELTIKLFGIAPIFGVTQTERPLLEKLHDVGTLYIENIENLDRESQEHLAEYIKYGFYRPYKSDSRHASSVRIICSSQKNLSMLMQEGKFSALLYQELKKSSLSMPSLSQLPEHELASLAQGYSQQGLSQEQLGNLIDLNERDTQKLATQRPVSLKILKQRVQQLLEKKSKNNVLNADIQVDPILEMTDPDLIQAARLGKYALRDQRMMTALWDKFKNQNKIATFLGVNRSSVNRRCKEYNLE